MIMNCFHNDDELKRWVYFAGPESFGGGEDPEDPKDSEDVKDEVKAKAAEEQEQVESSETGPENKEESESSEGDGFEQFERRQEKLDRQSLRLVEKAFDEEAESGEEMSEADKRIEKSLALKGAQTPSALEMMAEEVPELKRAVENIGASTKDQLDHFLVNETDAGRGIAN